MRELSAEHRPVVCAPSGLAARSSCNLIFERISGVQLRWAHRPGGLCSVSSQPAIFAILKTLSLLIATCALLTGCAHGPGPDDTIRDAYAWYLRTLKSGINPLEQRTELKEFVTEGFLVSLDNMRSALEASPFFDAKSFDAKLSIRRVVKNKRAARVRIELNGRFSGQRTLNVYLIKIDDSWKVDDVKVVEE